MTLSLIDENDHSQIPSWARGGDVESLFNLPVKRKNSQIVIHVDGNSWWHKYTLSEFVF